MDPALEADLGRAALPRLLGAPDDLVQRHQVGGPAEVRRELPLREGAEAAAEVADVRVLDVPGHDVRDLVAARPRAGAGRPRRRPARRSSPRARRRRGELVLAELVAGELERERVAAERERRRGVDAGRPAPLAREPGRVRRAQHRRQHGRVEPGRVRRTPGRRAAGPRARARGSASPPRAAARSGHGASGLTWSIVTGETPPQSSMPASSRRGNSSKARFGGAWTCTAAGRSRIRAAAIVQRWSSSSGSGWLGHARAGLGAEVLHDHLLQVAVLLGEVAERQQGVEPLLARLADPDQDPARERDPELAGEAHRLEPRAGSLSGEAQCGPPRAPSRSAVVSSMIPIDALTGRSRSSSAARHHPGVEVRQQPRLLEHEPGAALQVLDRRRAAERGELVAGDAVAELWLVAEGEERLGAAGLGARARDRQHLVLGQVRPLAAAGRPGEGAVAADVAAERRQRDEDLGRVRDERRRSETPRLGQHVVERRLEQLLPRHARAYARGGAPEAAERPPTRRPSDRRSCACSIGKPSAGPVADLDPGQQERVRDAVQRPGPGRETRPA